MGCTRKQIAELLHRAPKTIAWYCMSINRKLGFIDPVRLTHYAIDCKLIELNQII
jgi:DNA-binding CsgD family transcriptional regulator